MESYWPPFVKNPTGNKSEDKFAILIENIAKIVFSRTLKNVDWKNAKLANKDIKEEVSELRQQEGKDILVGSPGLIVTLTNLRLIDEFQLCVHPVITGNGLSLFKHIKENINLKLIKTKSFKSGALMLNYEPTVRSNFYP